MRQVIHPVTVGVTQVVERLAFVGELTLSSLNRQPRSGQAARPVRAARAIPVFRARARGLGIHGGADLSKGGEQLRARARIRLLLPRRMNSDRGPIGGPRLTKR